MTITSEAIQLELDANPSQTNYDEFCRKVKERSNTLDLIRVEMHCRRPWLMHHKHREEMSYILNHNDEVQEENIALKIENAKLKNRFKAIAEARAALNSLESVEIE
jgi:hypothetical protein